MTESAAESGMTKTAATETTSRLRPCSYGQSQKRQRNDQAFAHGEPL
jgi:hypothetical protein